LCGLPETPPRRTSDSGGQPSRRFYLTLLREGFTRPSGCPERRWALTPPFHPYRRQLRRSGLCGTFPTLARGTSVLPCPVEFGLSSAGATPQRPPHLLPEPQLSISSASCILFNWTSNSCLSHLFNAASGFPSGISLWHKRIYLYTASISFSIKSR